MPDAKPSAAERHYDAAFIGIPSPYRIAVLEKLAAAGFSLAVAGEGWRSYRGILQKAIVSGNWTSGEESSRILGQSKIGINLSVDEPRDRANVHISPRVYDVPASGCILVTEDVPLLAESLAGCTFHTFGSPDEACRLVGTLLPDYANLANGIEENRRVVLERHTYGQRVEELVRMAGKTEQQESERQKTAKPKSHR